MIDFLKTFKFNYYLISLRLENMDKYWDPKVALQLCKSMIEVEAQLKNKSLKKKQRKKLEIQYSSLLSQIEYVLNKPRNDLSKRFVEDRPLREEPYLSQFKIIDAKISPKYQNPQKIYELLDLALRAEVRLRYSPKTRGDKEKVAQIFLKAKNELSKPIKPDFFISLYPGEFAKIGLYNILISGLSGAKGLTPEYLFELREEAMIMIKQVVSQREKFFALTGKAKETSNREEGMDYIEVITKRELEFQKVYLIARILTIENKLKNSANSWKTRLQLQNALDEKQKLLELLQQDINFQDRIMEQSEILKDESLMGEEVKYFKQKKRNLRYHQSNYSSSIFKEYVKEIGRFKQVHEIIKMMFDHNLKETLKNKNKGSMRDCPSCGENLYGNPTFCIQCGKNLISYH